MSRLATSFVLGYHGCDAAIARKAVDGEIALLQSERDYDWLGPGIYFWESDPRRAREWAEAKVARGDYAEAAVIGAVVDLQNCLDLVSRQDLELLRQIYHEFVEQQKEAGLELPKNRGVRGDPHEDRILRYLDCAIIRHLHSVIESVPFADRIVPAFDTVRGMFTEGGELYPDSGFRAQTHVQIAVRRLDCIKGVFWQR